MFFLCALKVNAQTHHELWSKLMLSHDFGMKYSITADFQYRQQSNWFKKPEHLTEYPLARSARIWFICKLRDGFSVSISPFAYFRNFDFQKDSVTLYPFSEYRQAIALHWKKATEFRTIRMRFMFENRLLSGISTPDFQRWRFQGILSHRLTKTKDFNINLLLMEEYFLRQIGHHFTLDQNRILGGLMHKTRSVEILTGLQYTAQKNRNIHINRLQLLIQMNLNL